MAQLPAVNSDKLIGKRIQIRRKELGYSAEKLAEYINLSQQQLSRYERGASKINVAHLIDIAIFLQTPISWFFQDCMPESPFSEDFQRAELDKCWQDLSMEQKQMLARFLDSVKKAEH